MSSTSPASGLSGVWTDVLMPLQSDHSLDLAHLTSHLRTLHAKGATHFVLFGLAGEGPAFAAAEKLGALRHLLAAGFSPDQFMLGVSHGAIPEAVALMQVAYGVGVRRFLVHPPGHVLHPQQAGIVRYFSALLQALQHADAQIYLHLLESGSAADLPDAVVADVLRALPDQIAGLVDQGGVAPRTQDRLRNFGAQLDVSLAHEGHWALIHTTGLVSALANVVPHLVSDMLLAKSPTQATKIVGLKERRPDDRVQELLRLLGDHPRVPSLKLLQSLVSRDANWLRTRPPNANLEPLAQEALIKAFKAFNLQPNE